MRALRLKTKSAKYLLANYKGTQIFLSVPSPSSKEQKYYLDYYDDSPKKYYGKGSVKRKAVEYFNSIIDKDLSFPQMEAELTDIFKFELELIKSELVDITLPTEIKMRSKVSEVLKHFYIYKELQHKEGTVDKISLYGYKHHNKKLIDYFSLPKYCKLTLNELSSGFWLNYRIDLLNNTYDIGTKKLKNSSVNQHFQYVTQFYTWLLDYNELPIRNHLKKLKKLSEAQHDKRFKVFSPTELNDFYRILETKEKHRFTRLYLAGLLLYENNIRLSEQVLIRVCDIDLEKGTLLVLNKKNDSLRTVVMSAKVKELISIIIQRTVDKGIAVEASMYLIGGYNRLKSGMPLSHKELGIVMREFRMKYPQFKGRTLYEHKHTSITNQFDSGVEHYKIKERANHSSISTTEIYLQSSRVVMPYEFNLSTLDD